MTLWTQGFVQGDGKGPAMPQRRLPESARALRLALIVDGGLATSAKLLPDVANAVAAHGGVELVAVADAGHGSSRLRVPRAALSRTARWAFNRRSFEQIADRPPLLASPPNVARKHHVALLRSGVRGVNHPTFVNSLQSLRPDATLVLMVGQIFRPRLLTACGVAVNYHDGLLPAYRGIGATGWSVYHGHSRSGFSFALLGEGVDSGPVLLQGSVGVRPGETAGQVERAKTAAAGTKIGDLLELLASGTDGEPQRGEAMLFTRADLAGIRAVGDPGKIEWSELERRLRAFDEVHLELDGVRWPVTALHRGPRHSLEFATADGVIAAPLRIRHLPPSVHRLQSVLSRPRAA